MLPELDRPVGEALAIGERKMPVRVTDKGKLEVDRDGDGKFHSIGKAPFAITLERPGDKPDKKSKVKLFLAFTKEADVWRYRVANQISVTVGKEQLAIIDANGNGAFNEPGVDGICWAGSEQVWPLPTPEERFATATLDITGFAIGPWGEGPKAIGRPLATTNPLALGILKDANTLRAATGLPPRPEDKALSASLQKHCDYMALNKVLTHPEDKDKPGWTTEGNEAGMSSILSEGTAAERIATALWCTVYHRIDVVRPFPRALGVGITGRFGGINGRDNHDAKGSCRWPILTPAPEQLQVPVAFAGRESPDPIPGRTSAGQPIIAYFDTDQVKLISHKLVPLGGKSNTPVECFVYDPTTVNKLQKMVCITPKELLVAASAYEVTFDVEVAGTAKTYAWRFYTEGFKKR
jgi:hypothetical protein